MTPFQQFQIIFLQFSQSAGISTKMSANARIVNKLWLIVYVPGGRLNIQVIYCDCCILTQSQMILLFNKITLGENVAFSDKQWLSELLCLQEKGGSQVPFFLLQQQLKRAQETRTRQGSCRPCPGTWFGSPHFCYF